MKFVLVVVANNAAELRWITQHHEKLLKFTRKRKCVYTLQNGVEVHYLTQYQYDTWKLGRTYMHLIDYLMGNDCFYHSGHLISREQVWEIMKGGEAK